MNNTSLITPEAEQKLAEVGSAIKTIITKANAVKITNDEELNFAAEFLGDLKGEIKSVEETRKTFVKPFQNATKRLNDAFKIRLEPLQKVEIQLKGKVKAYTDEQARKADEKARLAKEEQAQREKDAAEKIKAAEKAGDEEALKEAQEEKASIENEVVAVEATKTSVRTESGLVSQRKVWKFEVVDEEKIPREFLTIDEKKINQAIRDGAREIAGIKIFQDTQISVR